MRLCTGTSGYSYKEWKGPFYPEKIKPGEMLAHYAGKLGTVEINATFYRMPSKKMLETWATQVPEDFSFVLKASRRITHKKGLEDVDDSMEYLMRTTAVLGERLGPMLFQFPPYFKKDVARLTEFLKLFPEGRRAAFEFRSSSWRDEEVYAALRARGIALVVADTEKKPDPEIIATADFGYLRLRQEDYDDAVLERWLDRIHEQSWKSAHVFFKHEDAGAAPRLAGRMAELAAARDAG